MKYYGGNGERLDKKIGLACSQLLLEIEKIMRRDDEEFFKLWRTIAEKGKQ